MKIYPSLIMSSSRINGVISTLELRRLLYDLKDNGHNICVRFRVLGQMWHPNFVRVIQVTEKGAVFRNEDSSAWITLADLHDIMQFELDNPFRHYQPHFHYDVLPTLE